MLEMVLLRFMGTDCNKEEYFFNFSQLRFITIFRSVATSDCWAPTAATSARARRLSETETHNYANFPGMAHGNHMNSDDKNFLPGIYAVSLQMFTRFKVAKDKVNSYASTQPRRLRETEMELSHENHINSDDKNFLVGI